MEYNPLDPEITQNPYPTYAALRREAPVCRTAQGLIVVSRYADALAVIRDPVRFSSAAMGDLVNQVKSVSADDEHQGGETLIGTDPPRHGRLRKIVNRAFTPRRIAALESRIRELARELVAAIPSDRSWDLVPALAAPLPAMVIAEILGVDTTRRADFMRWSKEIFEAMSGAPGPKLIAALAKSGAERGSYLDTLIAERRVRPRNDVVSALVEAESEEGVMTENEVGNFVVLLLAAGIETTTYLIGNSILALLEDRQRLAEVASHPGRVSAVVEETLRYDSPAQLMLRRATEDVELSGGKIDAGDTLAVLIGSANRDESQFEHADVFDMARQEPRHLSFGFGTHFCVGASLARLETRVALDALLSRFPRQALAGDVTRAPSFLGRGARSIPLRAD
ncbi:MAG: cytochrome P450 [Myxococcota bacterium]